MSLGGGDCGGLLHTDGALQSRQEAQPLGEQPDWRVITKDSFPLKEIMNFSASVLSESAFPSCHLSNHQESDGCGEWPSFTSYLGNCCPLRSLGTQQHRDTETGAPVLLWF